MAKRYSGNAHVTLSWADNMSAYRASVSVDRKRVWSGVVVPPAVSMALIPVDSTEAYDDAARAAIAFAVDELGDKPEPEYETVGGCDRIRLYRR